MHEVSRYGIIDIVDQQAESNYFRVTDLVEKPEISKAPSNLAIMGRYILSPKIFEILDDLEAGAGGEIQLTDAIARLNLLEPVYACNFEGKRYDVGEKFGFIKTTLEMALSRPELRDELYHYLVALIENMRSANLAK
jgi:UTP--glucose-1-phosphate uridylyltransferase